LAADNVLGFLPSPGCSALAFAFTQRIRAQIYVMHMRVKCHTSSAEVRKVKTVKMEIMMARGYGMRLERAPQMANIVVLLPAAYGAYGTYVLLHTSSSPQVVLPQTSTPVPTTGEAYLSVWACS
jgi:hypothetical protein